MAQRAAAGSSRPVAARRARPRGVASWLSWPRGPRLPGRLAWRRALHRLKRPYHASGVYRWSLGGRVPAQLAVLPPDPWPGEAALAQAMLQNRFTFAGRTLADPAPFWAPLGADAAWCAELHGFAWLRDLRVLGGDAARRRARELVGDWIGRHPGPRGLAWEPEVLGRRLAAWLGGYEFFAASADPTFKSRLHDSMLRQARHLSRTLPAGLAGSDLIAGIKGLVLAGVALPDAAALRQRGLALLEAELPRQILADGGHIERSPSVHLQVLRDLIDVRAGLAAGGHEAPRALALAIDGMTPPLKLFQHADGGLALFNDSEEERPVDLDMTLQRAGGRARAQTSAPQSGFQRLHAGRTLVVVDAGAPPPRGYDKHAHAGTLSFELSHGRHRIITNCGARRGHPDWRRVQRATAAHSTLTLAETNSSELLSPCGLGRRPGNVVCRRDEAEGASWLDMTHDGYAAKLGALHERRLYLAAGGDDLRGEDMIDGPGGLAFAIRFHLHPDVRAGLVQDGAAVLLRTRGSGWRLRAVGAELGLEESVYLGRREEVRRSLQVVLSGTTETGRTIVKWALKREGGKR